MINILHELDTIIGIDETTIAAAKDKISKLALPPGSLGRLHELAIQCAGITKSMSYAAEFPNVLIFAADHGVAENNVSIAPQKVTKSNCELMLEGTAPIANFCRILNIPLTIVDVGVIGKIQVPKVIKNNTKFIEQKVGEGTKDLSRVPAMTETLFRKAFDIGRSIALGEYKNSNLIVLGDMGIGNTTTISTLVCSLLELDPHVACSKGSGLDEAGYRRKKGIVRKALDRCRFESKSPLKQRLIEYGGFEIVAIIGAIFGAVETRTPIIIDGIIVTTAALYAIEAVPKVKEFLIFGTKSNDVLFPFIQKRLKINPLIDFGMRLGEGSAAILSVPIVQCACSQLFGFRTFEEMVNKT